MLEAVDDLSLERMWIVYPGSRRYELSNEIEAIGLSEFTRNLGEAKASTS
jgi:hypothetical protein